MIIGKYTGSKNLGLTALLDSHDSETWPDKSLKMHWPDLDWWL